MRNKKTKEHVAVRYVSREVSPPGCLAQKWCLCAWEQEGLSALHLHGNFAKCSHRIGCCFHALLHLG